MSRRALFAMASCAVALSVVCWGCSKSGPCSGGGMALDARPLPADWAAVAPPPDGAVACHSADGSLDQEYVRSYEIGSSPEEGVSLWRNHLDALGWQVGADSSSEDAYELTLNREGSSLTLFVSRSVTDKGWSTVTFRP